MTKSVTNLMVGRLVQAGEVSLDDDHLRPEWTDERGSITVRQLMQMTSGLAWDETYDLGTPITKMLYTEPDMARTSPRSRWRTTRAPTCSTPAAAPRCCATS